MTFSVVIPAYNEARYLPRLLDSIEAARATYGAAPDAVEVVVGNNGSTDDTAAIATARGCIVVNIEKRAIAAARNGAGRAARGDILCFIDADSIIHRESFREIERVMNEGRCVVGATGVQMERMSVGIWLTFITAVVMIRVFGVDTGVVFCRREDFTAIGGYRDDLLAAEDIDFLWRLKRLGRGRGQRFVRARRAQAITSTRKFDRHGDWHYWRFLFAVPLRLLFRRQSLPEIIRGYWYEDRRD